MPDGSAKTQVTLNEGFEGAVVRGGIRIEFNANGGVDVYAPVPVVVHLAANDDAAKAKAATTLEIGAVALAGDHKGEIYGGILPSDNKPIWFLAAPKSMDHFNAASWATKQGGALPTRAQGDYLTTLKGKGGAFTESFNRGGSFPAGYVWLAEPFTYSGNSSWCQRLSDGDQYYYHRGYELPVLCVRR
jgi:hypothetical protein